MNLSTGNHRKITADAEVRKMKNNKELVLITVVVNDSYKPKNDEEQKFDEYFNCSYWLNTKVADHLPKGSIVTVTGRLYLNEYKGKDGNQYANLAVHVNHIKILVKCGNKAGATAAATMELVTAGSTDDDLPF